MQYTLMFYMSPAEFAARTDPDKKAAFWGAFMPYMQAVREAGILKGGAGLEPPKSARPCECRMESVPCRTALMQTRRSS